MLDMVRPGWHAEINTARFSAGSCRDCVIGQLYGDDGESDPTTRFFATLAWFFNYPEYGTGQATPMFRAFYEREQWDTRPRPYKYRRVATAAWRREIARRCV